MLFSHASRKVFIVCKYCCRYSSNRYTFLSGRVKYAPCDRCIFSIGGRDEAVIARHGERLCHFHFHDAAFGKDHLPLGTGEIDLGKYLDMAREREARIVLETKTIAGLKASAEWIKKQDF